MKNNIRIPAIVVLATVSIWMAADMAGRNNEELLWGYRPLVFFLAGWGALVLLFEKRYSLSPNRLRWLGLSTLSGVLLGVGFPDILPVPFLMFVGFVPLLMVEREIAQDWGKADRWEVFKYAYHTFVLWNIIATYWVANTAFVAGIFAIWVNALLMSIPFLLFHTSRQYMPRLGYLAFIAYWLTFEFIHLRWELTWPWLTLGNSFAEFPALVQWYEYTGVFGGGLWILLANVLALQLWDAFRARQPLLWPALRLAGLILLPVLFSLVLYYNYEESGVEREVVVVQPNFEPHYEKFERVPESEQISRFLELSRRQVDENTDYLVFPETSFGLVETSRINAYPAVQRIREAFQAYPRLKIITGIDAYHIFLPGEPHSHAVREQVRRPGDTMYYEILNAAIQIEPGNPEVPLYRKSKLVPGPEILPYRRVFFFLKPLVEKLEGTTAGVGTQPERSVLASDAGKIAPAICYESVFGEYVTQYIRKGAQAIFIMTNDGWWDNTAGHRQHLYFASLRAIETRRAIARSANTGISAFVSQRGDILQPTRYDEPVAIKGSIRFNDAITFYVRWGDIIARIALFASILLVLNTFVRSRMKA
ncbi:MAG: apolipoprotein N-acyltransferase [Phaeodactylibacter sp.]|nr:apolipoprotein N-acyltransferase [Phaeodactylibacter sp.]MCB9294408.1 apolipoprotein N-acyltransferase [Lewinellaceae bacterium]